jgi:hypothetical protein
MAKVIADMGMKGMSYSALNAIADMYNNVDGKFNTTIGYESDGVTNGVILSEAVYGTASIATQQAGGLYTAESNIENVPQFRDLGGQDYYQQVGAAQLEAIQGIINEPGKWFSNKVPKHIQALNVDAIMAFQALDKTYGTRKGAKVIATPFNYGAQFNSINRRVTSEFIEGIYSQIEKNVGNKQALQSIQDNLNTILDVANVNERVNLVNLTEEQLLNFVIPENYQKAIYKLDAFTRGIATRYALQKVSGDLITKRETVFKLSNIGFGIFEALWTRAKEDAYDEECTSSRCNTYACG